MKRQIIKHSRSEFQKEAERVLSLLRDRDGFVLTSNDLSEAGVFEKTNENNEFSKIDSVERDIVEKIYVRDWLEATQIGKVRRYRITKRGLEAIDVLAKATIEDAVPVYLDHQVMKKKVSSEKPVRMLARKTDKNGRPYISQRLVAAAERLHEDFAVSGLDSQVTQNWRLIVEKYARDYEKREELSPLELARARWAAAMQELGAGLADIAYLVCCLEEGLEPAERLLDWSARSGKIVLRIALIRLAEFYEIPNLKHE